MTTDITKPVRRKPKVEEVPKELQNLTDPNESITVRNTRDTISVFVMRVDGANEISEFGPLGNEEGKDIMELPSRYLKNADFRKAIRAGVYEIIEADNPAVVEAYQAQQRSSLAKLESQQENSSMVLAQSEVLAFSGVQCIEQEGRLQCSKFAIRSNNSERPPLCSEHAYLSSQYVSEETGKFDKGKPVMHWTKVLLGR